MGISQRAYAKHRKALGLSGGTPRAVAKAVAAGRISAGQDGLIDPVAADKAWAMHTSRAWVPSWPEQPARADDAAPIAARLDEAARALLADLAGTARAGWEEVIEGAAQALEELGRGATAAEIGAALALDSDDGPIAVCVSVLDAAWSGEPLGEVARAVGREAVLEAIRANPQTKE